MVDELQSPKTLRIGAAANSLFLNSPLQRLMNESDELHRNWWCRQSENASRLQSPRKRVDDKPQAGTELPERQATLPLREHAQRGGSLKGALLVQRGFGELHLAVDNLPASVRERDRDVCVCVLFIKNLLIEG